MKALFGSEKVLGHIPLSPLPFQVGRQEGLSLTVPRSGMSRVHAEFHLIDGKIFVRDFGSTNGTYVNSVRLAGEAVSNYGDVIRFGSFEVRLVTQSLPGMDLSWARTLEVDSAPEHLLAGIQGLQELLAQL